MPRRLIAGIVAGATATAVGLTVGAPVASAAGPDTLVVNAPPLIADGHSATTFTGTAENNSGAAENARYDITFSALSGLTASKLHLLYSAPNSTTPTLTVPLTDNSDGSISGYFGPQTGFSFPTGTPATTTFSIAVDSGVSAGTITTVTKLDVVDGTGAVTATKATSTTKTQVVTTVDASAVGIRVDTPATVSAGAPATDFSGTATNETGATISGARYDFTLTGPSTLKASQLTLTYLNLQTSTYDTVPLTDGATPGVITGYFGPTGGFPFQDGLTNTTPLKITVAEGAPAGAITAVTKLDKVDGTGAFQSTVATDTARTITVVTPTVTTTLPTGLSAGAATGTTFPLVVTNASTVDYPKARVLLSLSGLNGLSPSTVTLESTPGTATSSSTYTAVPTSVSSGGPLTASVPATSADLAAGAAATTTTLRIKLDKSLPKGTLHVVSTLQDTAGSSPVALSTATGDVPVITVPGVPTVASAVGGNGAISVTVTPPADNGGSPIAGYLVAASGGGKVLTATITGTGTSALISGATNGVPYTVVAAAGNAAGLSAASNPVAVLPSAPTVTLDLTQAGTKVAGQIVASGVVTQGTSPVANAPVSLVEAFGDGRTAVIGTATTNSLGAYTVLNATALGSGKVAAVVPSGLSPLVPITVQAKVLKETISRSGSTVTVKATITPGVATNPYKVQLIGVNTHGQTVKSYAHNTVGAQHVATGWPQANDVTFKINVKKGTTARLRVVVPDTTLFTGVTTATSTVTVT